VLIPDAEAGADRGAERHDGGTASLLKAPRQNRVVIGVGQHDEIVGNAVEDVVVGISYPGYNWIVKGENTVTNGWIKLEMK